MCIRDRSYDWAPEGNLQDWRGIIPSGKEQNAFCTDCTIDVLHIRNSHKCGSLQKAAKRGSARDALAELAPGSVSDKKQPARPSTEYKEYPSTK